MAIKAEGIWGCTVISGKAGEDDKGIPNVQITVQITEGPSAGQRCTYEDRVDAGTAKYVGWSLDAVGWDRAKNDLSTLEKDIETWIAKTGGASTVEIKHLEIKRGQNAGKIWDKVNGIGRGAARALKPMSKSSLADANEALRSLGGPPPDNAPAPGDEDIPFITACMTLESQIAKVLR